MAGVSALLKSASATAAKIQAANDAEVAFEWENSAQTYDDYIAYSNYLQTSAAKTTDPTKLLSYDTKQRTAFRSYTSNEIQRQTQGIIEGNGTIQNKMSTVADLYDQAVANGDYNLAQNLISTWDSLSVQAQNQLSGGGGSGSGTAVATAFKNQVSNLLSSYQSLTDSAIQAKQLATNDNEWKASLQKINNQLPDQFKLPDGADFFDMIATVANLTTSTLNQAVQLAPDPKTRDTLQSQYNDYIDGKTAVATLPGADGKSIKLTVPTIQKQLAAAGIGETLLQPETTADGTVWLERQTKNYTFSHDANGNVVAVPTYNLSGTDSGAQLTDVNGNTIKTTDANGKVVSPTAKNLLERQGFEVADKNGAITVVDKTGKGRINGSNSVEAYIDANGNLQYVNNENQEFAFNFGSKGKFLGVRAQSANPFMTVNPDGTKNVDSPYFNTHPNDAISAAGTAGLLTPQSLAEFDRQTGIGNMPTINAPGGSALPRFSNPTQVLQSANIRQQNFQDAQAALQARQIVTAPVPQIQAPSLNPQNISNQATIKIAPVVAPKATISTAPQKPQGTFNGVSTAMPKWNISF